MSPRKRARNTTAALATIGAAALLTAAVISISGWPLSEAAAGNVPASRLSVSDRPASKVPDSAVATAVTVAAEIAPKRVTPAPRVKRATPVKRSVRHTRRTYRSSRSGWRTARVSWYGPGFYGNTMAGGGKLTRSSMVVAHRSLPFGTRVQIRYNGRVVTATVRDRGPYVGGREFDLGPGTARSLGFGGVGTIEYRVLG